MRERGGTETRSNGVDDMYLGLPQPNTEEKKEENIVKLSTSFFYSNGFVLVCLWSSLSAGNIIGTH